MPNAVAKFSKRITLARSCRGSGTRCSVLREMRERSMNVDDRKVHGASSIESRIATLGRYDVTALRRYGVTALRRYGVGTEHHLRPSESLLFDTNGKRS